MSLVIKGRKEPRDLHKGTDKLMTQRRDECSRKGK